MNLIFIIFAFLFWRIIDFIIIFFSQKFVPYSGFFPYADQLRNYNVPSWIYSLANFDGIHYILIAKNGYSQFEQAFFPLFPLTIRFFASLFLNNQLLAGLIISNISFLVGLFFFYKYLILVSPKNRTLGRSICFFLLLFPTSFFYGAVYASGLLFLLLTSSLFFLKKKKYFLVGLLAIFASLTKLVGVFLIIPIVVHFIEITQKPGQYFSLREMARKIIKTTSNTGYLFAFLSPFIGLAIYSTYLFKTTGDPLFFLTSQPFFGANRSTQIILLPQVYWRYIKIFTTAAHDAQYFIAVIEFLVFNFVFAILILDLIKNIKIKKFKLHVSNFDLLGLNLFSFATLILPTLTGTLSSIPRYALHSLSFFIFIARIKNKFIKSIIVIVFIILHIILLGLFTQGYFVS